MAAYLENAGKVYGWSSSPTQILVDHFAAKGIPLGDVAVKYIVSNLGDPSKGSLVINDIVEELEGKLSQG